MTTLTISTSPNTSMNVSIGPWLAASNTDMPSGIPAFIRGDEAYYWSAPWQADVKRALEARRAGDSVRFDSDDPNDVVRWLFDVDDES